MRIGYLIPEYPGQTHDFFRREMRVLERAGVSVEVASTRRPPAAVVTHEWSRHAMAKTFYLYPVNLPGAWSAMVEIVRAGPRGWLNCMDALRRAEKNSPRDWVRLCAYVIAGATLAARARRREWSHLHVHSCANSALVALFAKRLSGLPYSLTLHGALSDYGPNQRLKWGDAAFGLVITKRLYDEVHEKLNGAVPHHVHIAPMGVDMEIFKRSKPYEPWREGEQLRLFCCGRLNEGKGHQDLVETIKLLLDEGIDARLDLAGEDDHGGTGFRKTLEKLIADRGVGQNVSLLGATASETVRDYLERAHVFTLATRHEALGVATMEAMAMEVPVVVCDVGGVGELVANEEVGLLVEPRNPAAMAKAVNRLMHDPELARRLGDGGRKAIADRFHSGLSANAIYQELCGTD